MQPGPAIVELGHWVGSQYSHEQEVEDGLAEDQQIVHLVHHVIAHEDAVRG